jgi:HSP20 family molecular chaperone IbpA
MRTDDRRLWMWAEALDLLQGGERLQRRVLAFENLQSVPCWEPAVDLYENSDELRLLVALPGVDSRQIEVVLDEAGLVVRGPAPDTAGFASGNDPPSGDPLRAIRALDSATARKLPVA